MCGVIAIFSRNPVNQLLYDGLTVLQHRGQDAAGIVTYDDGRLYLQKDNGLVRDVFHTRHMQYLQGHIGIGHVRYPTAGCESKEEAQPFYVNSPHGITLAHNGNLTNAESLKQDLFREDLRHINTDSDSEVLLNIFAHELQQLHKYRITEEDVFAAVRGVHQRCRGSYAVVGIIAGYGIVAFRDPYGIRPLAYGQRDTPTGKEYIVASESSAIGVLGFELVRDVGPGEAILIRLEGQLQSCSCFENPQHAPCIFEIVYLARPDSIIDGISVYKARMRMGKALAKKILKTYPIHDIDVVIPIPDTSCTAALQLATVLKVKYREGFVKNRYIPRTFIMPGQGLRKKSVRQKLNPIDLEFRNKNVLLVDDSIVRGTTSQQIIQLARDSGAKKVYFASASPPIRYPNVYGIDMPAAHELLAHNLTVDEVCEAIGADWLIYQDLEELIACARKGNKNLKQFDTSCFTGQYVTGDVDQAYLEHVANQRNDDSKTQHRNKRVEATELHTVA